jgi:hypothetical protein
LSTNKGNKTGNERRLAGRAKERKSIGNKGKYGHMTRAKSPETCEPPQGQHRRRRR